MSVFAGKILMSETGFIHVIILAVLKTAIDRVTIISVDEDVVEVVYLRGRRKRLLTSFAFSIRYMGVSRRPAG